MNERGERIPQNNRLSTSAYRYKNGLFWAGDEHPLFQALSQFSITKKE